MNCLRKFDMFYITFPTILCTFADVSGWEPWPCEVISRYIILRWNVFDVSFCYLSIQTSGAMSRVKAPLVKSEHLVWISNLYATHSYHEDCFPDVTHSIVDEARGVDELVLLEWLRGAGAKSLDGDLNLLCKAWHHWWEKGRKVLRWARGWEKAKTERQIHRKKHFKKRDYMHPSKASLSLRCKTYQRKYRVRGEKNGEYVILRS